MGTYELVVQTEFSATHRLRMHDGRYEPLHGHTWRVEVFVRSHELDAAGLVADFTTLSANLREITGGLHETCLNELPAFSACNPSAELVAKYLHDRYEPTLPPGVGLVMVRMWETDHCAAAYIPPDTRTEGR